MREVMNQLQYFAKVMDMVHGAMPLLTSCTYCHKLTDDPAGICWACRDQQAGDRATNDIPVLPDDDEDEYDAEYDR